jgi:hypothetical protein
MSLVRDARRFSNMDMVRRAYLNVIKEQPATVAQLHSSMVMWMVRWIKFRVYSKRDWPAELGEYPKHLEAEIKE